MTTVRPTVQAAQVVDDVLDIAYLAIGADAAWRENDGADSFEGFGHEAVISEVIAFAANLRRAWSALGDDGWDGVWYYEVSEPLGEWIVEQWVANKRPPNGDEVDAQIAHIIASCSHAPQEGTKP